MELSIVKKNLLEMVSLPVLSMKQARARKKGAEAAIAAVSILTQK